MKDAIKQAGQTFTQNHSIVLFFAFIGAIIAYVVHQDGTTKDIAIGTMGGFLTAMVPRSNE